MSLFVVSRRKVVFEQASLGAAQVIYVPSADQTQVLKDAAGTTVAVKATGVTAAAARGPQLARVQRGQRTLYGYLPNDILELRQTVKVWLAEDLAPPEAEAFFYIFSPQVVVHGVRERNDEGRLVWRTAQLQLPAGEAALPALQVMLSDFSLANPGLPVCLAVVNEVALFRTMQQGQAAHGYTPVPFSTLKPMGEATPLYAHSNFTWLYLLLLLAGAVAAVVVGLFWVAELAKARDLERQIDATETQIQAVQINKRTGHIRQPDLVLKELTAGIQVSPSALVLAAGQAGAKFGDLQQISLAQANSLDPDLGLQIGPEVQFMQVMVSNPVQGLLVDQAAIASTLTKERPWVRQIIRQGQPGEQLEIMLALQITGTIPPAMLVPIVSATLTASATEVPSTSSKNETPATPAGGAR